MVENLRNWFTAFINKASEGHLAQHYLRYPTDDDMKGIMEAFEQRACPGCAGSLACFPV